MQYIHLNAVRTAMRSPKPFSITFVKKNGEITTIDSVLSLKYDKSTGTRTIKSTVSGEIRRIRDVCILAFNSLEVIL